ncbi:MAG TPA: hypothetical protein VGF95_00245 [Solirubrobacteraceae bacterium]|jgi:hypothetical protein
MPQAISENLRSAVYASHERLAAQVQADSALDAKLLGLLGFFAAAASLLLTLHDGLRHERVLLLVGLVIGMAACLTGSVRNSNAEVGPSPGRFYADYGLKDEIAYLQLLLADLVSTTERNDAGIAVRRRALAVAAGAPALLTSVYILVLLL